MQGLEGVSVGLDSSNLRFYAVLQVLNLKDHGPSK